MIRSIVADDARWISLQDLLTWLRDPSFTHDGLSPEYVRSILASVADALEDYGEELDAEIDRDREFQQFLDEGAHRGPGNRGDGALYLAP